MVSFEIQYPMRPEVKTVIQTLRQRGVKYIAIVSGDHECPTKKLAKELEVDDYFYDVLPHTPITEEMDLFQINFVLTVLNNANNPN